MRYLTKEEDIALWKALEQSTKLICKGRLVTDKELKDEEDDFKNESDPTKESKN